jgi:hypothetical protein
VGNRLIHRRTIHANGAKERTVIYESNEGSISQRVVAIVEGALVFSPKITEAF